MPRGNGFRGAGMWSNGYGYANSYGYGYGCGPGGNFGPNCRMYPSLPRRWWATGEYQGPQNTLYPPRFAGITSENELLQAQAQFLKKQLNEIEKRLEDMGKKVVSGQE